MSSLALVVSNTLRALLLKQCVHEMFHLHLFWGLLSVLSTVGFSCRTLVCNATVFIAGLGTENLVKVECNAVGQMLPEALDQALVSAKEQGKVRPSSLDADIPCDIATAHLVLTAHCVYACPLPHLQNKARTQNASGLDFA